MKTAWFLMHRIRMAMDGSSGAGPMGGPGKIVEADETFITRSPKTRRPKNAPPREDRQVMSLVERGGTIRSVFLDHNTVRDALWQHLDRDGRLYTDGAVSYRRFVREHSAVDHSKGEYVRGDVHVKLMKNTLIAISPGSISVSILAPDSASTTRLGPIVRLSVRRVSG